MNSGLYGFLFAMWILIILGGGILVIILGPISLSGYGDLDYLLTSGLKTIVAVGLVVLWVIILSKIKNQIFQKKFRDYA